jgi:hypothetical protein
MLSDISNFYKLLGLNCLTVVYDSATRSYLIDTFKSNTYDEVKKEIDSIPKVILLYHSELNDKSAYFISKYNTVKTMFPDQAENLKLSNYNISINGLDTCEDEITFNCHKYKLDSCLIDNKFSTVGMTCNNKKIVYNYKNDTQLIDFNWNIKKSSGIINKFCFKSIEGDKEECITFNEGVRLFVYIKIDPTEIKQQQQQSSTLTTNTFNTSPTTVNEIIIALSKLIQENKQL